MHLSLKTWVVIHVCYREIFRTPVLIRDLKKRLKSKDSSKIDLCISSLIEEGILHSESGYIVRNGNDQFIKDQPAKSQIAKELLNSAQELTRFISLIPFVKFVGISVTTKKPTVELTGFTRSNVDFIERKFLRFFKWQATFCLIVLVLINI